MNSDLQIQTANLNGKGISTVVQLDRNIVERTVLRNIAVNTADDRLYWTVSSGRSSGRIQRVNLDGTNVETLVSV